MFTLTILAHGALFVVVAGASFAFGAGFFVMVTFFRITAGALFLVGTRTLLFVTGLAALAVLALAAVTTALVAPMATAAGKNK